MDFCNISALPIGWSGPGSRSRPPTRTR